MRDGSRHVTLTSVVPGRRYAIGNGEGCDIVVNGKYASRRHCEIWLDQGAWWVTDSGSTNGIRVESATSVLGDAAARNGGSPARQTVIEVVARRAHRAVRPRARRAAAVSARSCSRRQATSRRPRRRWRRRCMRPRRPSTPIVARARRGERTRRSRCTWRPGERTVELPVEPPAVSRRTLAQPGAGRSIGRTSDVSGHHVDIVELGRSGATVVVHGDNGVHRRRRQRIRRERTSGGTSARRCILGRTIGTRAGMHADLVAEPPTMSLVTPREPLTARSADVRARERATAPARRGADGRAGVRLELAVASGARHAPCGQRGLATARSTARAPVYRGRRRRRRRRDGVAGEPGARARLHAALDRRRVDAASMSRRAARCRSRGRARRSRSTRRRPARRPSRCAPATSLRCRAG